MPSADGVACTEPAHVESLLRSSDSQLPLRGTDPPLGIGSPRPADPAHARNPPPRRVHHPHPKPKKRRAAQADLILDEGKGLSSDKQQYDATSVINEIRSYVETWRHLPANLWQVTPETARLLQHWRHHPFSGVRPFFCQIEAVETAIWLTEVAPNTVPGKRILELLAAANREANPQLSRLALKLATGAGKTTVMAMLIAW